MSTSQRNPIEAVRSLVAVLRDPDDTKQVFRLFEAVAGGVPSAFVKRFERSRKGARLLEDRPEAIAFTRDVARLEALPEGSLGRAYLAFMQKDGLTPDWLVSASESVSARRSDSAEDYVARRLRDTHDLWHVVTGYGGDLLGEAALLAFTYAQSWNPGVGLLASVGLARAEEPDARRLIVDAFARGARAAWLPGIRWEDELGQPLESVRARLRVGPPPTYEPFYAKDLPTGGLTARAA